MNITTPVTFNKATKTLTFTAYTTIAQERIKIAVDVTRGVILYSPVDATLGGTVATNVLTLTLDTTGVGFANTDLIMVTYDDTKNYSAVSITNPTSQLGGIYAALSPTGALQVTMDSTVLFADTFEGGAIDTTVRWTASGTVIPTLTLGVISVNPSTTASATSALNTQPGFSSGSQLLFGFSITLEAATVLGNHRFWGIGTPPSTPGTSAAPLQEAAGFELDTSGVLRASMYSAGTRIFTQTLTKPTDAVAHRYAMIVRGDIVFFYLDTFDIPGASFLGGTNVQSLPIRLASLNSASVTGGTPTLAATGAAAFDIGRNAQGISDATYPWRKTKVNANGGLNTSPGASSTSAVSSVAGTTTASTVLLAANANRLNALIFNDSTSILYVALSATCTTSAYTLQIAAKGYYEMPSGTIWTGVISGVWVSATGNARITELT